MKNYKNILTNQYFILTIITLAALFIRLLNIDKPTGLWYDEMLTYIFSSKNFPLGILKALWREDFHMPLYYMYVHIWMKLFGSGDIILRLSSVFWGVLTVPAMFYLGKTYKSKSLGYLLAIIGCLSPIMIYYSQEVRFYSMLMFLSTVSVTFFLKFINEPDKKDFSLFFLTNLLILYIYTLGIIFVGIEILILLVHFYLYRKEDLFKFSRYLLGFVVLSIPYFSLLVSYLVAASKTMVGAFAWGDTNTFAISFLFNDWFSPVLRGIYGHDINYIKNFFVSGQKFLDFLLLSLSTICFVIGIIRSYFKIDKKLSYLTFIVLSFIFVQIILNTGGNFVILTRYTLIVFPILLLISTSGLLQIKSNGLRLLLFGIVFIMFISNVIYYKVSPAFENRLGGYRIPSAELKKLNLTRNDFLIYPNRTELIKKYTSDINMINFDIPGILYLDKTKEESLKVFDKDLVVTTNRKNACEKLMPYFLSDKSTSQMSKFAENIANQIPKGRTLVVITDWFSINPSLRKDFITRYRKSQDYYDALFDFAYGKLQDDLFHSIYNTRAFSKEKDYFACPVGRKNINRWHFVAYRKIK